MYRLTINGVTSIISKETLEILRKNNSIFEDYPWVAVRLG